MCTFSKISWILLIAFILACEELPMSPDQVISERDTNPQFVFIASTGSQYDIFTYAPEIGLIKDITNSPESETSEFKISPDGLKILYERVAEDSIQLCTINIDGSNFELLATNSKSKFTATFSPDGKEIIYSTDIDGDQEVYIMNLSSKSARNISNLHEINGKLCNDNNPVFSSNELFVAFSTQRFFDYWTDSKNFQIALIDLQNPDPINISETEKSAFDPKFSYNSDYLTYAVDDPISLYSYDLNTKSKIQLTGSEKVSRYVSYDFYSVSPTENLITYSAARPDNMTGACEIYLVSLDGNKKEMITNLNPVHNVNTGNAVTPNFNSDGSKIVFIKPQEGTFYTINLKTNEMTKQVDFDIYNLRYVDFIYPY
jgi:Tol biopolymer transport system component